MNIQRITGVAHCANVVWPDLGMCARAGGRVISLHSRSATGILLDVLREHTNAGRFILHWYLGSARQIARATEMGCWFSIGPSMMTNMRSRAAVAVMPRDRVLPESDGPFGLLNGQSAYPWEAWSVVSHLADIWREPQGDVEEQLFANFKEITALV